METTRLRRRLTAVLFADVVGYSRLMSVDEEGTHVRLADYARELIEPKIAQYGGRLLRTIGDGFLVEFSSAADAVWCGLDIQDALAAHDAEVDSDRRIRLRIGINTGDVIVDERDIYGNNVNIAARLEGLAEPGEIYVTRGVRDQLQGFPHLLFEDRGDRRVKNIRQPIRVYRVRRIREVQGRASTGGLIGVARRSVQAAVVERRRSAIGISILLAAVAGITAAALPIQRDYSQLPGRASIMVMPFRNASGNPEGEYFADAVTDDLTTDLSRLSDTSVIAPATAFTLKGKAADPREIGRDFGVRYVLEGSIRRLGTKVQTNAQLIDTRSAAHIWADRFEYELGDLAELQDAVTGRIASSLHLQLVKAEARRAVAERSGDPDAIDLRLHAMALVIDSVTPEHTLSARQLLEESVQRNPQSAQSWAQLANLLIADYFNHWNEAKQGVEGGKDLLRRAESALQQALKIDPSLALAHYADGFIRRAKGDHAGSLDAFDRVLQLDPNFARGYAQKANQLVMLGRPKEAPPLVMKAISLSPRDPYLGMFYWVIGRAYFVTNDYEDAIVWLRKSVQMSPDRWYSRAYLLSAYKLADRNEEAKIALSEFNASFGDYTVQRIRDLYEKERNRPDPGIQASIQALYRGLKSAGLP